MKTENSQAPTVNEQPTEVMTFQFSESKQELRNIVENGKPWFIAKDVCDVLGLTDTNKALQSRDEDEKLTEIISWSGQGRKMWFLTENG